MQNIEQIQEKFFEEYDSADAVKKYSAETAGHGINYLLQHDYAHVYFRAINSYLKTAPRKPLRILEFGCGAGMNVINLISQLEDKGVAVGRGYGTDFSPRLVQSAQQEAKSILAPERARQLSFYVASNERLVADLSAASGGPSEELIGSFDLIIGVNTFRYCHRLGKARDCVVDIYRLLRPGGVCVVIDMNDRFPAFRSRLRGSIEEPAECYLPSLAEYASPFEACGFEVLEKGNFCWIPHSAGRALTVACWLATPVLDLVARRHAMRSLVVARKPA